MKWIGQHIWDFVSRFRNDVYIEDLTELDQEFSVMIDADGKLTKSSHPGERSRIQVRNNEGSTIPAGAPLYSKGEIGGSERILVGICVSSDPAKMPCIGIAEFEMNTSSTKDSFAITQGVYNTNISNFTGLSVGDTLYVNGGVAPHLTQNKPTNGDLIQNVGIVLKTNGTICQGLLVSAIGRTNDVPWPLYVDHTTQRVGIGTSSPESILHVNTGAGTANANTVLIDRAGSSDYSGVSFATAGTVDWSIGQNSAGNLEVFEDGLDLKTRMTIETGGNVGIGTTSPAQKLHVDGNIRVGDNADTIYSNRLFALGNADFTITSYNGYDLLLNPSAGDNVGIGTTTPTSKLHVIGDARIQGNLTVNGTYTQIDTDVNTTEQWLVTNDGTGPAAVINQLGSQDIFDVQDDGTSVFYIEDGGNIGVGTTNPTNLLHVQSTTTNAVKINNSSNSSVNIVSDNTYLGLYPANYIVLGKTTLGYENLMFLKGKKLRWAEADNSYYDVLVSDGSDNLIKFGSVGDVSTGGDTAFYHDASEKMRLTSTGLGIGTTSPQKLLEVKSSSAYNSTLRLQTSLHNWDIQGGESGYSSTAFAIDYDGTTFFRAIGTTDSRFSSGLSIGSISTAPPTSGLYVSGNVGIGQTSPAHKLDVAGYIRSANTGVDSTTKYSGFFGRHYTNSEEDVLAISTESTSSNNNIYIGGGFGTRNSATTIRFSTAANNTTTTGTERMRIDSSGNVGIGTTSPTAKLHVFGDASDGWDRHIHLDYNGTDEGAILTDNEGMKFRNLTSGNNFYFRNSGNGTSMIITDSHNVGIGTTSPGYKFVVNSSTADTVAKFQSTDSIARLELIDSDDAAYVGTQNNKAFIGMEANATGTNNLIVTSDGNVGIGTTSPSEKLEVSSAVGSTQLTGHQIFMTRNGNNEIYAVGASSVLALGANGAEKMRITSAGNVGVGTNSPSEKLEVNGNIKVGDGEYVYLGNDNDLRLIHSSNSFLQNFTGDLYIENAADDKDIIFNCDDGSGGVTPYLTIDGGLGHTTIDKRLRANDNVDFAVGTGNDLRLVHDGTHSYMTNYTGDFYIANHSDDKDIIFQSDDGSGGLAEYFRVDGGAEKVEFSKDVVISDISSNRGIFRNNNGYNLNLGGGTVYSDGAYLSLSGGTRGGGTSIYKGRIEMRSGGSNYSAQADITGDIVIGTQWNGGTSDILTLDSSTGNVGIGTTSPQKKLDIASGDIRLDNSKSIFFATTDANIGRVSITGDEGSDFIRLKVDNNNSHVLHLNTTGVGVGTTSPSEKLEVDGNIKIGDGDLIKLGDGGDLSFIHSGTNSFIQNSAGDLSITNYANDKDILFQSDDGSGGIATYFYLDGSAASSDYYYTRFGDKSSITFGDGNDLRIYHDSADSSIENENGHLYIQQKANDKDIIFRSDDGSGGVETYFFLDGSNGLTTFPDNKKLTFGNASDLRIFHDSGNSFINQTGTGHLYIQQSTDDHDIVFQSDDGSGGTTDYLRLDGGLGRIHVYKRMQLQDSVGLYLGTNTGDLIYHNGSNTFWTHQVGDLTIETNQDDGDIIFKSDDGSVGTAEYLRIDGGDERVLFSKEVRLNDSVSLKLGSFGDLQMYHDGSNSYMRQISSGNLYIDQLVDDSDIVLRSDDGSGGLATYLQLDGSSTRTRAFKDVNFDDSIKATFGASSDLQIYHDGSHSYIKDSGTGNLRVDATNFFVRNSGGTKIAIDAIDAAEVALRYDGSRKLETTSTGVEVTGNINVSGSVQRQISTTHHTFTTVNGGSAAQDYWVPFIGSAEQAAPNVTHRTIAPYGGILKKAIVHSTAAFGSSAQVRFHRIDNGTASVFTNDNSTDDVTTNVTRSLATAYTSTEFVFTTGNTFSTGDQIGVSFVRDNTAQGDVAMTLAWEYELF